MGSRTFVLALAAVLPLAACAQRASFQPTENATGVGLGGQPAAAYDVRTPGSDQPTVHVNVWSQGARVVGGQTHVYLALEIRNTGNLPVSVDPGQLALDAFDENGAPLGTPALEGTSADGGNLTIAPGATATVRLSYALAAGVGPTAIASLRLRWGLALADGERYLQYTEFARTPEAQPYYEGYIAYDPVFGYYDPFFFGPAYGVRVHWHAPIRRVVVHDHRAYR